jgi:hypothetical protein
MEWSGNDWAKLSSKLDLIAAEKLMNPDPPTFDPLGLEQISEIRGSLEIGSSPEESSPISTTFSPHALVRVSSATVTEGRRKQRHSGKISAQEIQAALRANQADQANPPFVSVKQHRPDAPNASDKPGYRMMSSRPPRPPPFSPTSPQLSPNSAEPDSPHSRPRVPHPTPAVHMRRMSTDGRIRP